ncbi:transglutaminase-like domain-containing protein [Porphyrobacter sp. ULC335]|uniref:transglutaminase-like domain-containing protein n=1 Tax=Porphyrobacter sp. ULC335 TaxID=2854260 RepID=UPI00221E6385|nr:transglutaminase family protein [Porphyrobacter sp. ULC335]UYV16710.1 transglutaminase family protein [Porphyrobacter sp. ULC335]
MDLQLHVQLDYWFENPCDVLLQVEAAAIPGQAIADARMTVSAHEQFAKVPAQDHIGERIWLRVAGQMLVDYRARVTIDRIAADLAKLPQVPLHQLPGEAVPYLMPSRYCPSSRFADLVATEFANLQGGARIVAMRDWIADHLTYEPGASNADTTAVDTFVDRKGVCRDYAHLMIAFARSADIPARIASVYAPGVTPPDFHAVAEVFLDGAWHLVDATGMASAQDIAIIGIGRDIGDVAFLTAFGALEMRGQSVAVTPLGTVA